jgi:hypothetical protein
MMLFRRPLFQIIKTYGDKPRSSSDSSRMRWDEIHELFLYGPNPTCSAIQLERGLIEAVIMGRSPLDAGVRVPYPSR